MLLIIIVVVVVVCVCGSYAQDIWLCKWRYDVGVILPALSDRSKLIAFDQCHVSAGRVGGINLMSTHLMT